jgi:hypothetical protein
MSQTIEIQTETMKDDGEIGMPGGKYLPYRKGDSIATVVGSTNRIQFILPAWFKFAQVPEAKEPMVAESEAVETTVEAADITSLSLSELTELAGEDLIRGIKGFVTKSKLIKAIMAR